MTKEEMEEVVERLRIEYQQVLHEQVEAEKKVAELKGYSQRAWLKFYEAANVLSQERLKSSPQ